MRYLVKLGELRQKIEFLEKQLSIIDDNVENLKIIKTNIKWEGEASNSFDNKYNEYLKELTLIEERILSYIKYLIQYYESYGAEYKRLRTKYANINNMEA